MNYHNKKKSIVENINYSHKRHGIINSGVQYFLLFFIAILVWQIYYPGLMSPDSIGQIIQAHTGIFDDANPPLMSIVLWMVMKFGGDIGTLILFQCLSALFGLRALLSLCLRFFSDSLIPKPFAGILATIVTILFLVPFLSPFMFFSVIFWKDAWVAILLLWATVYLLWIFLNLDSFGKKRFLIHVLLLAIVSSLTVIVRHNAIVVIPVVCLAVAIFAKLKLNKRVLTVVTVLPLLLALALNPLLNTILSVNHLYFGNTVLASDMTILLKLYPELQAEYPLTARHQNSPIFLEAKQGGTWDQSTEGKPCPVIDCDKMPQECYGTEANTRNIDGSNCYMPFGNDNKVLKSEYIKALTTHPFQFAHMKIYLYLQMWHPRNWWRQKLAYDIVANPYDMKPNENFSSIRANLNRLSQVTGFKWYFIWLSGIHIIWLVLNILGVIYSLISVFKRKNKKSIFELALFLIPLSYYFSYILAAIAPDYRYMYPSTLLMQAFVISILLSKLFIFFKGKAKIEVL